MAAFRDPWADHLRELLHTNGASHVCWADHVVSNQHHVSPPDSLVWLEQVFQVPLILFFTIVVFTCHPASSVFFGIPEDKPHRCLNKALLVEVLLVPFCHLSIPREISRFFSFALKLILTWFILVFLIEPQKVVQIFTWFRVIRLRFLARVSENVRDIVFLVIESDFV